MFMIVMCMICNVYDLDVQAYCLYPKIYNYNYNYNLAHDYPVYWTGQSISQWLLKLKNANTEINTARVVSIAKMSWHVHKNSVMRAVKSAWAQENFDAGAGLMRNK